MNTTDIIPANLTEIGTVTLVKEKAFSRTYSYPVWHAKVNCPRQRVVLYAVKDGTSGCSGYVSVTATLQGRIVEGYPRRRIGLKEEVALSFPCEQVERKLAQQLGAGETDVPLEEEDFELYLDTEQVSLVALGGAGKLMADPAVEAPVSLHAVPGDPREFRSPLRQRENEAAVLWMNGQPCVG